MYIFDMQINIEIFQKADTIILDVCNQTCPKYPK